MKRKDIKNQIRNYFYANPTKKLRVRQIEREVNVPLPSAIRYSKDLEEEKILKHEVIGNVKFYSADRSSKNYKFEKTVYNLRTLRSVVDQIVKKYSNPTIVVFGSYSKGEDIEESDVDLYIETPMKKINVSVYEKQLNRKIQLFVHKSLDEINNKELVNNIINGIKLNGYLGVYK